MSTFSQVNTVSVALPNAVDATLWPGATDVPLVPPVPGPGASWACDVLYPSPDCTRKPALTATQLAGMISNLAAMTQCLADYVAVRNGANYLIPSCEADQASFQIMGTLMCDVLAKIQAQLDAMHPAAMISSANGTVVITASGVGNQTFDLSAVVPGTVAAAPGITNNDPIPTDHYGTNAEYLGTPVRWVSFTLNGVAGTITLPSYT